MRVDNCLVLLVSGKAFNAFDTDGDGVLSVVRRYVVHRKHYIILPLIKH